MLLLALGTAVSFAAEVPKSEASKPETLRGKLTAAPGKPPSITTPDHRVVVLDGDGPTKQVLSDKRLNGFEMVAKGHFTAPDRFTIDPFHTKSMFVNKDGHLKVITYWCDTCSIRAYTPGPCVCCQQETTLDLRDPDTLP